MSKRYKEELIRLINWYFQNCKSPKSEVNLRTLKNLLYAKITCMSHEVKFSPKRLNSLIHHQDRYNLRQELGIMINEEIELRLKGENGKAL